MSHPCFHKIVAFDNKSMTGIKRFGCYLSMQHKPGMALSLRLLK
jgi:hypothetical protein